MATLHLANEIFNLIYPVGSIYLSVNTTNPSTYFGGTWERVADEHYLIGYNPNNDYFDKPGAVKGSKNGPGGWNTAGTALTVDQIPSHNHLVPVVSKQVGHSGGTDWVTQYSDSQKTINVTNTGGGKAHTHFHVEPYYTVVVWKRTK